MKGMKQFIITGLLVLATTTSMAATKTAMDSHWICTTNASSSTVEADKAADDKMAKKAATAKKAFAFASAHCRDCTKISCEAQSK